VGYSWSGARGRYGREVVWLSPIYNSMMLKFYWSWHDKEMLSTFSSSSEAETK